MPWNNGGPTNGGSGDGAGPGGRPENPWGSGPRGSGGNNGGPRGPWGPQGPRPSGTPPDLDELIEKAQGFLRGMFGPGGGGRGMPTPGGWGGGRGLAVLAAVGVAAWLFSGFYRVQPDEQGVVLRFGAYNRTTFPGLNYAIPWPVETVLRPAVTRFNRVDVGYQTVGGELRPRTGRDTGIRDIGEESLMLTGDENIIDIECAVFWRIRDAESYLFNTRNPAYTVKSAAESVMREVIGKTPIQPALTDARAAIELAVKTGVQAIMDQYGSGVEITQVQLQKVDPPAAVIDSFRDVQRASTDADRMRNEAESYRNDIVPRARGDAARLTAEAEAAKQGGIAEALGQAQRFESVLKAYDAARDVTMKRIYIETMQEILSNTPTVVVDDKLRGVVPYLPLGDLPAKTGAAK